MFAAYQNRNAMKKSNMLTTGLGLVFMITSTAQTPAVKKVLVEEFTTTLCGNCPPKTWDINLWHDQHAANSILMTLHEGFGTDAMSCPFTDAIEQEFANPAFGFAPAMMLDRVTYPWISSEPYMIVNGFDTIAQRLINTEVPRVAVQVQGTYNSSTRQVNATVTANFLQNVPGGDYRINLYLVEDSVTGTGSGYDQKCYDASWANAHYPGQYNSTTDYITGYIHRHVLRSSLTPTWGASGVIPNTPALNTNYSTTVSYTLPATINDARVTLVAFVAHHAANSTPSSTGNGNRWVLNANEIHLTGSFTTAVMETEQAEGVALDLYPNPASGPVTLHYGLKTDAPASLFISDLSGKKLQTVFENRTLPAGENYEEISLDELAAGLYFATLVTPAGSVTKKILLRR